VNAGAAYEHRYEDWPSIPCRIANPRNGSWVRSLLGIDTGADVTILDERLARELGIDLNQPTVSIRGYGGRIQGHPAIVDVVPLSMDELRIRVEAIFAPNLDDEIGSVLGLDYFAFVDLLLAHSNNLISLRLPA
jgi:predicted aspartyl protease